MEKAAGEKFQRLAWYRTVFLIPFFLFIPCVFISHAKLTRTLNSPAVFEHSHRIITSSVLPQHTQPDFVSIAKKLLPAVVSVECDGLGAVKDDPDKSSRSLNNQNFEFYLPDAYRFRRTGTGTLISPDGYIVTNVHLVQGADLIEVTLYNKRRLPARLIGLDPLSEVAVIKIKGREFPFARLGNSEQCEVGQWVIAIGNPLGLGSTVTAGIISAKARRLDIIHDDFAIESFIQTDAAINPGNSGGPLINLQGEVIGINTAIATETGLDMGFAFAIPANLVRKIVADLIRYGKVSRAYLGIALREIDEVAARALKLKSPDGVFVDDVFPESPAAKAGVLAGDIIVKLNDKQVERPNEVQMFIGQKNPGDRIEIQLIRDGKPRQLHVELGEYFTPRMSSSPQNAVRVYKYAGIKARNLTPLDLQELGLEVKHGVFVDEVAYGSPAARAGLLSEDIVLELNKKPIANADEFYRALSMMKDGDAFMLRILRGDTRLHIFVAIPDRRAD